MRISPKVAGAAAVAIGMTVALSACGSGSSSSSGGSGTKGGTLRLVGEDENSSYDWAGAYDSISYSSLRAYTRQLYTNPSSNDPAERTKIVPDIAAGMPDVSGDGKTYTVKLNKDVQWNVGGTGRTVTAADVVRGIKMLCNPANGTGPVDYFTDSLVGMKAFCDGFADVDATSATAIKAYEEGHQFAGVTAVDDATVKFTLEAPASDFVRFLTLPASSPRPIEMMSYVPDSPDGRQHLISDGPYLIPDGGYVPNKSLKLVRNPVWKADTDTTRKAYVDVIETTYGGTSDSIQQQIEAGTADMAVSNEPVPNAKLASLISQNSSQLHINPTGGPRYLVFNTVGGSDGVKNLKVRQAISYAVNKAAIAQLLGGPRVESVASQIFSPSTFGEGFKKIDPYATKDNSGNTAKAKDLLAQAGYPNGITIKLAYADAGVNPKMATSVQTDLEAAGIKIVPTPIPASDYYGKYLQKEDITKSGKWDVALAKWSADWEGTAQRTFFSPLLDGRGYTDGSSNFGAYNNDTADKLADEALAATSSGAAASKWNEVDAVIMADAPWVPLVEDNQANFNSSRLKNFQYQFNALNGDITDVSVG